MVFGPSRVEVGFWLGVPLVVDDERVTPVVW